MCVPPISAQTIPPSEKRGPPSPWVDAGQESAIDQLFAGPFAAPGYTVALVKDGEFVFAKGYGLSNLDDHIPITPETFFHLASLPKQFTAAAVALLILWQVNMRVTCFYRFGKAVKVSLALGVGFTPCESCQATKWIRVSGQWWALPDLNREPTDYESAALTN
jgi:hypothetical protein